MPAKPAARKAPAKKAAGRAPAKKAAGRAPAKKAAGRAPAKKAARKAPAKKAAGRAPAKKAAGRAPAKKAAGKAPAKRSRGRAQFEIANYRVRAGRTMRMELPIANLTSGTPVSLPVVVVHGKTDGPVVWISAAVHGDEICGVEIVRRVLAAVDAATMAGTLIAVPVVNVHGFNNRTRYLPDRRDLNRSFPGSIQGSLASRIAALFMKEVVKRSDVGIDLHTGSNLRTNLPQIRCDLDDGLTRELAEAFGAPIIINVPVQDGSLRGAAVEAGKVMLLFEGGEANRFDPPAIAMGTTGILRTLDHLGMTNLESPARKRGLYSRSTSWVRANNSGMLHLDASLGDRVTAKQQIATIYDPFGKILSRIRAGQDGVVIGHTQAPIVNKGDALSHIAQLQRVPKA